MLTIRAKHGGETPFGKIISSSKRTGLQIKEERFIDRFATYFTPAVLIIAVMLATHRVDTSPCLLGCPRRSSSAYPCEYGRYRQRARHGTHQR